MRDKKVQLMVEISAAVALAAVLNFVKLFQMPQGGTVSLEMLPILIIAIRWGGAAGMTTGLVHGLLQLAFGAYIVHPAQLILDYPMAYVLVGLAGFVKVKVSKSDHLELYIRVFTAVLLGGLGRFVVHLLSGVIFFAEYAPEGQNVWIYSAVYNLSYIIPSILISYIIIVPILKSLLLRNE